MEFKEWIEKVEQCLWDLGDNLPIDKHAPEWLEDFESGLSPEESAAIAYDDFNNE